MNLNDLSEITPIKTKSLKINRIKIKSKKAMELTDDLWDAYTGTEDDLLPEVPPDASFEVEFSTDVYPDLLQNQILFYNEDDDEYENFGVNVTWCEDKDNDNLDILSGSNEIKDCILINFNNLELKRKIK